MNRHGEINNEKEIQVGSKVDVMIPQSDITNYKQIVTRKIVDSDKWTPAVESEPLEVVRILSGNSLSVWACVTYVEKPHLFFVSKR